MYRSFLLILFLVLAFAGLADSWYLMDSALSGTPLTCDIHGLGDCNTVAGSAYSWFLGMPLAFYGVVFYTILFSLSLGLFVLRSRSLDYALLLASGAGALLSAYFLYLQFAVIKALCIYCLTSAAISFLIFGLALLFLRAARNRPPVIA